MSARATASAVARSRPALVSASRAKCLALLLTLALAVAIAPPRVAADVGRSEPDAAFSFALVGDYPYFPRDDAAMPHLLAELAAARDLAFVLHVGDLHSWRQTDCGEALFRERRGWFVDLGHPFLLTPGDNDWADCQGDPAAHLATLRRVFFDPAARAEAARGLALRAQSADPDFPDLVENLIWERGGVVFATLHLVGHSTLGWLDEQHATKRRLVEGAVAWIDAAFRRAEATGARGVFLATQVDPWAVTGNVQILHAFWPDLLDARPELAPVRSKLIDEARAFGGPVVFAHGDTHVFRVDKPLFDEHLEMIQNVTRLESFGSPHGHWVRVLVEPEREEVFTFREEWVPQNLYTLVPKPERNDGFEDFGLGWLILPLRILQAIPTALAIVGALALLRIAYRTLRRRRT